MLWMLDDMMIINNEAADNENLIIKLSAKKTNDCWLLVCR